LERGNVPPRGMLFPSVCINARVKYVYVPEMVFYYNNVSVVRGVIFCNRKVF
jgi:hypothetical protein